MRAFIVITMPMLIVLSNQDLWMLGRAEHGTYKDDCKDIHPNTIAKYYGTDGHSPRLPGETGAGNPLEECVDDLARTIRIVMSSTMLSRFPVMRIHLSAILMPKKNLLQYLRKW